MRIVDASSARIWALERKQRLVGREANFEADLYLKAARKIADKYPTRAPEDSSFYLEGRRTLARYERSLVDIREASYGTGLMLRNARMSDEQIERLIVKMNLTPR